MKYLNKILQNTLINVVSFNSIGVIVKISCGFIISKALAISVGPSGLALLGNLRNFTTFLEGISTLGFQTGIVKYIGENENNKQKLIKIVSTIFISYLFISIIFSLIIFLTADYLSDFVFGNKQNYSIAFKAIALTLPWYVLSILFTLIINGLQYFKKVIIINIVGNLIGLIVSIFLIYQLKIVGALLSVSITPALFFIYSLYYLPKKIEITKRLNFKEFDFKILKKLTSFSLMILTSAIFGPLFSFEIRKYIIVNLGIDYAGFCEAISKISNAYLMFISSIISLYFYPKLIKATNNLETKIVIRDFFKYIVSLFIIASIAVYFSRFVIVDLLFTKEFYLVNDLFFWQLIGDFFKVCALILGIQFFTKELVLYYVISELSSYVLLYFFSIYFIQIYGIQGVAIAQCLDNFVYLIILVLFFRKSIF